MRKSLYLTLFVFLFTGTIGRGQSSRLPSLEAALPHIRDSVQYVDALNRVAMLLYEKNVDSTFFYARRARAIADRLEYARGRADALNNLGVVYDIKGNLQLGLRYYDEAYTIYRTLKDSADVVQALMNIAMLYQELNKDHRSIAYFDNAMRLGRKLRRDSILSLVIYNYVLEYPSHFSRDSVSRYIDEARYIAAKYKDNRVLVATDQLIADDLIAHGQRDEGIALLEKTIAAAIDSKLYYVVMDMLTDLGDRLAKTDPVRAAAAYRQGLTIAGQNNYLFYSQQMARKLFDFYTARGDNLAAAAYSRQLVNLNDEQDKLSSSSGIDYLDYALKDEQVRLLTIRSGYETYLLAVSLVAFLLAVAVLIVIRRNLKRTTNQNHQMQIALDALEQSQADNARMMKIAAHDLRNPIGAMHSLAGLMLSETDRPASDRKMLEMIRTSGENSLELVSDLLEVQFRTEELDMEPVDIAQIVGYCVSLLKNKAEAKGQYIQLEVTPVTLRVSREKMWRVVSNLIANAIKFSPAGALIRVSMQQLPQCIRILVKDDGIGIPPEMKDKVFDMFTEAKRTGTDGEQPFGLGLAISKQIVEAHGGRIWFESEPGKGTTFFVELPLS